MILATAENLNKCHAWVYVLACEEDRIYVGFAVKLHARLKKHFSGTGDQFTKQFKPLRVVEIRPARTELDEFRHWESYAAIYGRIRVGGYCESIAALAGFKLRKYKTWIQHSIRPGNLFRPSIINRKAPSL